MQLLQVGCGVRQLKKQTVVGVAASSQIQSEESRCVAAEKGVQGVRGGEAESIPIGVGASESEGHCVVGEVIFDDVLELDGREKELDEGGGKAGGRKCGRKGVGGVVDGQVVENGVPEFLVEVDHVLDGLVA